MSGRNLIMGLFSNMTFDQVEKFLGSLRRTTFQGDVCMLVDRVTPETTERLRTHGVIIERATPVAGPRMPILSSRFFNYLEFLAGHGNEYDNVMLSDLRDVVFQSDPFASPLPADIVFAQERCLISEPTGANYGWLFDAYGEAVAQNLRDFSVSCAGTTFGTAPGIMRYLVAMTRELRDLPPERLVGGVDQAVHNYVVRMRPLRDAWCDPTDSLVATMHFMPDASVQTTPRGVLIDGRLVPVLHQWDRNRVTHDYVWTAPQFRLDDLQRSDPPSLPRVAMPAKGPRRDAVVAFHHRPRDENWLAPFLASLRGAGFAGDVHCLGEFDAQELGLLARYDCSAHASDPLDPARDVENVAHLMLSRVLDGLAADVGTAPDQVLVLDNVRGGFQRDPFQARTIGLSVFCESPTRVGESEYNLQRLAMFAPPDDARLHQPVISSAVLRGPLDVVRAFYRKVLPELAKRAELMGVQKVIQGAINKVCHDEGLGFPVTVHPHGSEVYFDLWPCGLDVDLTSGVQAGCAIPAIVLSGSLDSRIIRAVWSRLGLAETAT